MTVPRFSTLANLFKRSGPDRIGTPDDVVRRSRQAEAEGYDMVCVADLGQGEIWPALTLVAQSTERIAISTRVMGVFTHAPTLFASGSAWIDRISGGRFTLALGASLRDIVEGVHGNVWANPADRMEDTLKVYRAVHGDDVPGTSRTADGAVRYEGKTLSVQRAVLDLPPHGPRPPIWVAAIGPKMLRVAGAYADGVIIEYTSPGFIHWAWDQIRAGAATTGRSLENFTVCAEVLFMVDSDDSEHQQRTASWMTSYINHAVWTQFDVIWREAGLMDEALQVRAAAQAGDRPRAEALVREHLLPATTLHGPKSGAPAMMGRWLKERLDAGVEVFAVPIEMREMLGIGPNEARTLV